MKGQGRILLVLAVVLCLMLVTFGVASAITNGVPDGGGHPYVGAITFYGADGQPLRSCTGALIATRVVLTAGHCIEGAASAGVSFASSYNSTDAAYRASEFRRLDDFCIECDKGLPDFATQDVSLVILSNGQDLPKQTPAELPAAEAVSELPKKSDVDLVGYGVQRVKPSLEWYPARLYAPAQFINIQGPLGDELMKVTANPGQGKGGSCFGDSGGPVLMGGTNVILGINSFAPNANCAGVSYATRIDTPEVLGWIAEKVAELESK